MRSTRTNLNCIACGKPIAETPRVMRLQIVHGAPRLLEASKKLGFTSETWRLGDSMQVNFCKECFSAATLGWKAAFHTRALAPRLPLRGRPR